jgi:hypothetical protein
MSTLRLPTQFDDPRRGTLSVATPTCGCCCCCCCAVTLATSATLTAVHLHGTAALHHKPPQTRRTVTIVGALSILLTLAALAGLAGASALPGEVGFALGVAVLGAWYAGLFALYRAAGHPTPWVPPLIIVAASVASFTAELFSLGLGFWGQLLAIPLPIMSGYFLARSMKQRRSV